MLILSKYCVEQKPYFDAVHFLVSCTDFRVSIKKGINYHKKPCLQISGDTMGCIPSVPVHGGIHDEDYLTMPSLDDTSDTCPYHRSAQSASSPQGGNSLNAKAQQYTDRPTFLMQLFQTILIFVGLYYVCIGVFKVIPLHFLFKSIMNVTSDIPKSIVTLWTSTKALFKAIDSSWILRKPANWWETNEVDWDQPLFVEVQLAKVALAAMVLDLLFSSEKKQGNPILLTPTLLYSVFYFIISVHAQATKLLDPAIYQSFNATKIGLAIFSQPEIVALTFTHLFALDLALAFAMMKDFYCRISSRRLIYRFLMIGIVLGTIAQGITMLPFYLFLKWTIFASPLIHSPRPLPTNRNSHDREFNYLLDPIPRGSGAINGWIQSIPSPMNIPFMLFYVALGVARFVIVLATYFLYVTFICIPVSAVFFCLRRSWRLLLGKEVQGALYTPLATLHGTNFPPKAILIVSAHIRLICFKHRSSFLFNILIGWWLRKCMEAYVMYEFTLPFKNDFSPYIAFLMEEFGPVFPMGEGLGFGGYKDVKAIIENPDQRKSGISLAWSISCAQFAWSKNNLTTLPQTEIEKSIVIEGRELVRCWLKDVSTNLQSTLVRKQLDAILPYANIDGSMIDKKLIEISFGSTLFHLLTDGELTELERKRYYKLLTNAFPFMSDWINKVWFGGILEFKGIQDYGMIYFSKS